MQIIQYPGYLWNIYDIPWLEDNSEPGPLHTEPDYFLDTIRAVKARVGDQVSVHGEVFSHFTHYLELFSYQAAIMGLVEDHGKVKALLERLSEAAVAWAVAQARSACSIAPRVEPWKIELLAPLAEELGRYN